MKKDPVVLEVVRNKLEAIVDEGSRTIQRTGISPVIAEAGDCSCALFDGLGALIAGGGAVQQHFKTGSNCVSAILERHGDTLSAGDVFAVNDPYSGGGFHAQDVFILVPIYAEHELAAWVGASAHMMDMGGSVPGSFVPEAIDCVQEALRFPPVRLTRAGEEQVDTWAFIRTNVRMSNLIEMDMRALIAGCTVVKNAVSELIAELGPAVFADIVEEQAFLTEREFRRRIAQLEPGEYFAVSWTEWTDELFRVPCRLTIDQDKLRFDYSGAASQSNHYFNSKPYVIKSLLGVDVAAQLARDLPFNEGIFRAIEIHCEPGSITDAQPPAPIGGPHLDIGQNATEVAMRCLTMAVVASEESIAKRTLTGPSTGSGYGLHTWAGLGLNGQPEGWLQLEGGMTGGSASADRDGNDNYQYMVGKGATVEVADVEVLESWYPIQFQYRRVTSGVAGAGEFRGGCGSMIAYRSSSAAPLKAAILGNRERVPVVGTGGGYPAALTRFTLQQEDGRLLNVPCHSQGTTLQGSDLFCVEICGGSGWGDPLRRKIQAVEDDVRWGRLSVGDAADVYGVVCGDNRATDEKRASMLQRRLEEATAPEEPLNWTAELEALAKIGPSGGLLYPNVEQQGGVAVSLYSGHPLAVSPGDWTRGCATIRDYLPSANDCEIVAYLDPLKGFLLAVDVVAEDVAQSFYARPLRWTDIDVATNQLAAVG
ncbi:MAG: hydantoinase B/oxoprolinase family protein [Gammaproteobacteria bacterium]|nr:hydantoinase B/oxoprolinase family protein [Gammaproteobacteria bacterium]